MLTFTYTRNRRYLTDEDVYAITPIHSLEELLKDGYSLCLVWQPKFDNQQNPGLIGIRGSWHRPDGTEQEATLYYGLASEATQSSTKNALDRHLQTPYLFASWKKSGIRTFKIIHRLHVKVQSDSLADALPFLIEGHFEPRAEYLRKHTIMTLMGMEARRRREYRELARQLMGTLKARQEELEAKQE